MEPERDFYVAVIFIASLPPVCFHSWTLLPWITGLIRHSPVISKRHPHYSIFTRECFHGNSPGFGLHWKLPPSVVSLYPPCLCLCLPLWLQHKPCMPDVYLHESTSLSVLMTCQSPFYSTPGLTVPLERDRKWIQGKSSDRPTVKSGNVEDVPCAVALQPNLPSKPKLWQDSRKKLFHTYKVKSSLMQLKNLRRNYTGALVGIFNGDRALCKLSGNLGFLFSEQSSYLGGRIVSWRSLPWI